MPSSSSSHLPRVHHYTAGNKCMPRYTGQCTVYTVLYVFGRFLMDNKIPHHEYCNMMSFSTHTRTSSSVIESACCWCAVRKTERYRTAVVDSIRRAPFPYRKSICRLPRNHTGGYLHRRRRYSTVRDYDSTIRYEYCTVCQPVSANIRPSSALAHHSSTGMLDTL